MLVLPNKTIAIWERFLKDNKVLVYKYIVKELKKGIEENNERIDLFRSEDQTLHAWVPKNHIPKVLDDALKVFIKAEEYEYADKTKKIVNLYYIQKLINESTVGE